MRLTWRCAVRYHEPVATPDVRLDQLRNMISTASHEFSKSYFQAREEELYPESYGDEYKRKVTRMHTILYVALLAATAFQAPIRKKGQNCGGPRWWGGRQAAQLIRAL